MVAPYLKEMTKTEIYKELAIQISAVIKGETFVTARYASAACLLSQAFDAFRGPS